MSPTSGARIPSALRACLAALGVLLLLGAAPRQGIVAFQTSADAEILTYPRTDPMRIDLMVRRNRVSLSRQIEGLTARYLQEIYVTSIGGGTWFVTLHVDDPRVVARTEMTPGRLLIRLRPGAPRVLAEPEPATLADLLTDDTPRRPAAPPPLALAPLRGDASTMLQPGGRVLQQLPLWRTRLVKPSEGRGWSAVDDYRLTMATSDDPRVHAAASYRLGLEHLGLGWYREAAYYLERTLNSEVPFDVAAVSLAAARAHLVLGRADRTRQLCHQALENGASEVQVLACLGSAALHDGVPNPTAVGRALIASSRLPPHRHLAAQLLLADHRVEEARRILESLAYGVEDPWVHASLGDVRYITGDLEGAKAAWAHAATASRVLARRLVIRTRMAEMLEDGPSEWASRIPVLLDTTRSDDLVAAEAHYLLAQIGDAYGDPDFAAEHLNLLWDRFPRVALRSDAPERLMDVCRQRLEMLEREGRHADQVAFFSACWRPQLDELAADPDLLQHTSEQLLELGLPDEALALHLRAVAVLTRLGRDSPRALTQLTHLYVDTNRAKEALETLEYAETLPERLPEVEYLVAEARTRDRLGDVEGALQAWSLAQTAGSAVAARARGMLLARERRCEEAVELLQGATDDDGRLALGRCLLNLGRPQEAAEVLPTEGPDPLALEDAAWMLGKIATLDPPEEQATDDDADDDGAPDDDEAEDSIWGALLEEERAAASYDATLDARRR